MTTRTYFVLLTFYFLVSPFQWLLLLGDRFSVSQDYLVLAFILTSLTSSFLLSKISRLLIVTLPLCLIMLGVLTFEDYGLNLMLFASIPALPILRPKYMKWIWHSNKDRLFRSPRSRVPLPISINSRHSQNFSTICFDVSLTGFFVSNTELNQSMSSDLTDKIMFEVGNKVDVKIQVGTFRFIRCTAHVVRKSQAIGDYPDGVGFKFINMNFRDRKWLRKLISNFNELEKEFNSKAAA